MVRLCGANNPTFSDQIVPKHLGYENINSTQVGFKMLRWYKFSSKQTIRRTAFF